LSCELAHPWVLLCLGSPSCRSEGPKHSEFHRTRLDYDLDPERWQFGENYIQCDVNFLSLHISNVLFKENYEKICEACL
jgi:hypothetical protein